MAESDFTYRKQVLESVERAMSRSARAVHEDLKRGLNTLATIACLAPFLGILETVVWGLPSSFPALGTEKTHAMAIIFERFSESLVPTAFGLLTGLHSLLCYKYFRGRLGDLDIEMENVALQLLIELRPQFHQFKLSQAEAPDQSRLGTSNQQA